MFTNVFQHKKKLSPKMSNPKVPYFGFPSFSLSLSLLKLSKKVKNETLNSA